MSEPEYPHPVEGIRVVRLPAASFAAVRVVDLDLVVCQRDVLAWNVDWDRCVAPRLTEVVRAGAEVRYRVRRAWEALRYG